MQGTQVRQVLFKRPAPLSDRLCCEVPPEFSSCGGSNQTFMFYEVLTSLYHCNNHSIKVRQRTWGLLTWETETLHVLAVFTAKSGMEAPKVRVPTRDDGRNLIARARLDHMDRVQLERNGEQRVWAPRRTDLSHGTFKTSPVDRDYYVYVTLIRASKSNLWMCTSTLYREDRRVRGSLWPWSSNCSVGIFVFQQPEEGTSWYLSVYLFVLRPIN